MKWSTTLRLAVLKRAASMLSAMAMPTAVAIPWPRGPVVVSIPGAMPYSGWPAHFEPTLRKRRISSIPIS